MVPVAGANATAHPEFDYPGVALLTAHGPALLSPPLAVPALPSPR